MNAEDRLDAYLWDPAAAPDTGVQAIERKLAAAAFDPAARPLDLAALPSRVIPRRTVSRTAVRLALAASLIIAAGAGLWTWRWSWPEGRAWSVRAGAADLTLQVGQPVRIPELAIADIARIGQMRLAPGTLLELRATRGTRHRLRLTQGDVHVRVWAPPLSIVIETPQGEVIDMGCEFVLSVSGGVTTARVTSGWVQFENGIGETLIPEGASSEMSSTRTPGVPVFDDAVPEFRPLVRAIESGDTASLDRAMAVARARDVYTLLQLADRTSDWDMRVAEVILRRAAELSPPPDGVTIASIQRGSRENLWRWASAQDLPPMKSGWWKNWRDALPFWLR